MTTIADSLRRLVAAAVIRAHDAAAMVSELHEKHVDSRLFLPHSAPLMLGSSSSARTSEGSKHIG